MNEVSKLNTPPAIKEDIHLMSYSTMQAVNKMIWLNISPLLLSHIYLHKEVGEKGGKGVVEDV